MLMGDVCFRESICGLSKAQKRVWYGLNNQGDHYRNLALVYEIKGPLQVASFEQALLSQAEDNTFFDTVVLNTEKKLINKVLLTDGASLLHHEVSQEQSFFLIQKLVDKPFDLMKGRLYSANLLRCSDEHHYFVWVAHPLLLDRHSLKPLARDLAARYNALASGQALPEDRLQGQSYAAMVPHEQRFVASRDYELALRYWVDLLKNNNFELNLPIKGFADEVYVVKNRIELPLSKASQQVIEELCALYQVDCYTVMMTILQLFLYRYTHKEQVVVNYNVRPDGMDDCLGRLDNILSCSVKMASSFTLLDTLRIVHDQLASNACFSGAYRTDCVKETRSRFDAKFSGQYSNVSFDHYCYPYDDFGLEGLEVAPKTEFIEKINEGDVIFYLDTRGDKIAVELEYHQRFDDLTCSKMLNYFIQFTDAVCRYPSTPVVELPILSDDELQRLIVGNAHAVEDLRYESLMGRFARMVATYPNKPAIISTNGELSYRELNHRATQMAQAIRHEYIRQTNASFAPQTLVGICLEKGLDAIVAILAIIKAGGAYVVLSPDYPESRLQYIIEDSEMTMCITNVHYSRLLRSLNQDHLITLQVEYINQKHEESQAWLAPSTSHFNAMACLIYTSGSTGNPKGVQINQVGISRLVCEPNFIDLHERRVIAHASNLAFDASLLEVFGALLNGASLVIPRQEDLLAAKPFHAFLQRYQIDVVWLTVALFNRLATENANIFSSLAYLMVGGDALNPHVINLVKNAEAGAPLHLLNGYGPTESTTFTTTYEIVRDHYDTSIPIGTAISGTTCYVLDQHMKPCPVGIPGELYIGGLGLALGYWRRPDITKRSFVENPFVTEQQSRHGVNTKLYRTGDRVRWLPSGELDFIGRIDDQVKIRGFRIELAELESVLQSHALIQNAVVLVREDNNQDKQLVAYYRTHDANIEVDEIALRSFLSDNLPPYYMPAKIIRMDRFPITPNGKVDKRALPNPFAGVQSQLPVGSEQSLILRSVWSELLSVPEKNITDASDFFQSGGHSLLVTLLISKIDECLGVTLSVSDIFSARTFSAILQCVRDSMDTRQNKFEHLTAPSDKGQPLSFALQRGWYLYQQEPQGTHYNIPFVIHLPKSLQVDILSQSLSWLMARCDVFNLSWLEQDGQVLQSVTQAEHKVPVLEMQDAAAVHEYLAQQANVFFDLTRNDVYRLAILTGDELAEHVVAFNVHHAFFDGWSLNVFVKQLQQIYLALQNGQEPQLPVVRHIDYCYSQSQWEKTHKFDDQLAFWQDALKGELPVLALPTDYPATPERDYIGKQAVFTLDPGLVGELNQLAQDNQTSLFNLVLAAYYIFLYRLTGQNQIVVGLPTANRNHAFTHDIIGCLVNTLAYPMSIDPNERFLDFVSRLSQFAMQAMDNQDVPFDQVVQHLAVDRQASSMPVFQTLFVLQSGISLFGDWADHGAYQVAIQDNGSAKYDFSLVLYESEAGGLSGFFEYRTALFKPTTIDRYIKHFMTLLSSLTQELAKPIKYLSMLSFDEVHRLTHSWAKAQEKSVSFDFAHAAIEYYAHHTPNALALVGAEQAFDYAMLHQLSNAMAHAMAEHYYDQYQKLLPKNAVIGLFLPRSVEAVVTIVAILKLGATYLPLDKNYPQERLSHMISQAQPAMIICDDESQALLEPFHLLTMPMPAWSILQSQTTVDGFLGIDKNSPAYLIFTSGSTGLPKGVVSSHRSLANMSSSWSDAVGLQSSDRILQFASLNFDASINEVFTAFNVGAALHIVQEADRYDPHALLQYLNEQKITVATIPPVLLEQMGQSDLPYLKKLVVAGDVCKPEVFNYWRERCDLINAYGPTECGVCATLHHVLPESTARNIGRPLANLTTYVLDPYGNPVPQGVTGELYLGGSSLADGYLHQRAKTIHAFVPHPFENDPQMRLYKTGDLVKWNDQAELEFVGRNDYQVKIRGFRIELEEITRLISLHPQVVQATVVAPELAGQRVLVAYYTCSDGEELSREQLQLYLKAELPSYMVPQYLIALAEFTLTPNGKIDRKALPDPGDYALLTQGRAPQSEVELHLAELFCQVLGCAKISVEDDFFDLGGSSITSVVLVNRIKAAFPQASLTLAAFYQSPTIASLAERVSGQATHEPSANHWPMLLADLTWQAPEDMDRLARAKGPGRLLLTGASGFLGVHLLSEALQQGFEKIYCLLRNKQSLEKWRVQMQRYGLQAQIDHPAIVFVYGDFSQPHLGLDAPTWQQLANEVTHILHNGASVNHLYAYAQLREANVLSLRYLLTLATTQTLKPIHFISTFSAKRESLTPYQAKADDFLSAAEGYVLSKQIAEQLLVNARAEGVPISIYRPGNISGQMQSGRCAYEVNHQLALIKGCLQMAAMPDWQLRFEMTPVDFLAKQILHSVYTEENVTWDFSNPVTWSYQSIASLLQAAGYPLALVSLDVWQKEYLADIGEENALYPFKHFYEHLVDGPAVPAALAIMPVDYPSDYLRMMQAVIKYLQAEAFLPKPSSE